MNLNNGSRSKLMSLIIIVLLCSFSIVCFLGFGTVRAESNPIDIATIDECQNVANVWLKHNYNDSTTINEVIPIIEGDIISAYCIDFQLYGEPNGYVVVDANKNSGHCIREYGLSGKGIYDTLYENADTKVLSRMSERIIYSTGYIDYAIRLGINSYFSSANEVYSSDTLARLSKYIYNMRIADNKATPTANKDYTDKFYDGSSLIPARFKYGALSRIDYFTPSLMTDFLPSSAPEKHYVYEGNCSVTAATNLLSYYAEEKGFNKLLGNNGRQGIYNNMVKDSGFKEYVPSGKEGEGVTNAQIDSAMRKYVKNKGYKYSSDAYWFDLWSDFRRDIGNGYPVYTAVYGKTYTNKEWKSSGHAVVGVGYREYEINDEKYLRVLDGWRSSNDRYILFNTDYFTHKEGMAVKVK